MNHNQRQLSSDTDVSDVQASDESKLFWPSADFIKIKICAFNQRPDEADIVSAMRKAIWRQISWSKLLSDSAEWKRYKFNLI